MWKHLTRQRAAAARDEGTVAVLTAITIPVALLVLALALATLVWAASDTEQQRAADQSAAEIASSELLMNFPYSSVGPLDGSLYPTAATIASNLGVSIPSTGLTQLAQEANACKTVGDATTAIQAATGQLVAAANGTLTTVAGTVTSTTGTVLGTVTGLLPSPGASASPSPSSTSLLGGILGNAAAAPKPVTQPHALGLPTIPVPTVSATLSVSLPPILPTALPTLPTLPPLPTASPTPSPTPSATVSPTPAPTASVPAVTTPTLPDACAAGGALASIPQVDPISRRAACHIVEQAMDSGSAPYSNAFYGGSASSAPKCSDGTNRIRVGLATKNPLLGISSATLDSATSDFVVSPTSQVNSIGASLQDLGVHLDTSLPNLVCPQVNVAIDQPVKEPLLQHLSVPNGRATAQRVIKNAVVVPVFNGLAVGSASGAVQATVGGVTAGGSGGAAATLSPVNLNTTLLKDQQRLMHLLDGIDARVQNRLATTGDALDALAGVNQYVDLGTSVPAPSTATDAASAGLSLTSCLRKTLTGLFDPPASDADAPDAQETLNQVFKDASDSGDPIQLIQVGVVPCPGATFDPVAGFSCLQAATGSTLSDVTGLYPVPLFDVTPVVVKDVGGGNYQAVPVHATQAEGAFRAVLVRGADDSTNRYDPSLPIDTNPTPGATCDPLSSLPVCQSATSPSPSVSLPPLPTPSPTPSPTSTGLLPIGLGAAGDARREGT